MSKLFDVGARSALECKIPRSQGHLCCGSMALASGDEMLKKLASNISAFWMKPPCLGYILPGASGFESQTSRGRRPHHALCVRNGLLDPSFHVCPTQLRHSRDSTRSAARFPSRNPLPITAALALSPITQQ